MPNGALLERLESQTRFLLEMLKEPRYDPEAIHGREDRILWELVSTMYDDYSGVSSEYDPVLSALHELGRTQRKRWYS